MKWSNDHIIHQNPFYFECQKTWPKDDKLLGHVAKKSWVSNKMPQDLVFFWILTQLLSLLNARAVQSQIQDWGKWVYISFSNPYQIPHISLALTGSHTIPEPVTVAETTQDLIGQALLACPPLIRNKSSLPKIWSWERTWLTWKVRGYTSQNSTERMPNGWLSLQWLLPYFYRISFQILHLIPNYTSLSTLIPVDLFHILKVKGDMQIRLIWVPSIALHSITIEEYILHIFSVTQYSNLWL